VAETAPVLGIDESYQGCYEGPLKDRQIDDVVDAHVQNKQADNHPVARFFEPN
jgi:hypothetical protein